MGMVIVGCKRCLRPGELNKEAGELCPCKGELVPIEKLLELTRERLTVLVVRMADQMLEINELRDKDSDVVINQIGHMVGADDGMHVLDAVQRFVTKSQALAAYAISSSDLRQVLIARELVELIPMDGP